MHDDSLLDDPLTPEPTRDCPRCPRLVDYRRANRAAHAEWWNSPVPAWGDPDAWLCIVGMAPGVQGANRTGRPFTGDWAGILLFDTLAKFGLTDGSYAADPHDGFRLKGAFIANAVKCVPPQNKPEPAEIHACRPFLVNQLAQLPNVRVLMPMGAIAHQSALKAVGAKLPKHPFAHGAVHRLHTGHVLVDSYHCSRYNTNTGRLTPAMFEAAFRTAFAVAGVTVPTAAQELSV